MARPVVIAVQSYILKRGISAIIKDIEEADLIFFDDLSELNHYMEATKVFCAVIEQHLLQNKHQRDILFQLKNNTVMVAIATDSKCLPAAKKFDHIISWNNTREEIVPVFSEIFNTTTEAEESSQLLSERETEVLKLVALGSTNQQIAEKLFISKHTVISHRKNITFKLGIKTVSGLTVYAVLNNLIPKDQIQ